MQCPRNLVRGAKITEANRAVLRAARKVRHLEQEQWAEISPYLSKYELRKYKLEHSQTAHALRMETE